MRKVCIITGTRAEYGLLEPIIEKLKEDDVLQLQIVATGTHLSPEFGLTYKEIENDGFKIDEKIEILLSSDTEIGITKSMGLAMISFAECFSRLKPEAVLILGDRYEAFSAAAAAMISKIPILHLYGGEATEGLIDEAIRHSITKMSYLHFTSTESYRKRVIQLGEEPERVFNVGALGVENIMNLKLLSKSELEKEIKFLLGERFFLVTFHPVTLEAFSAQKQFENLLRSLDSIDNIKIIFTKANADTDGRIINKLIDDYVFKNKEKSIAFTSLGQLKYLSAMKYASAVVGNSSSGIIEAPSFKVPTINIGDRQKGRIQAKSVINCSTNSEDITKAIYVALDDKFRESINNIKNPYGKGKVSDNIISIIKTYLLNKDMNIKKVFYDLR